MREKKKINGNINANLNGMQIKSESLILESDADNYKIDSETQTTIETDSIIVISDLMHFDAQNGIGNFPDGAEFIFFVNNDETDSQEKSNPIKSENMFGQCLSIDTSGGRLITPAMQIHYTVDDNGKYEASKVSMPSGGELYPLESENLSESKFVFGNLQFNVEKSILTASDKIKLVNGECEISADKVEINWSNRHLLMSGDVKLTRDIIHFKTGTLEIIWDNEGRISLTATQKPCMCINIPEETTDELTNT